MNDPIIDEVHQARIQLWERCGQDWNKLGEYFEQRSAEHPERMVTREELEKTRAAAGAVAVKAKIARSASRTSTMRGTPIAYLPNPVIPNTPGVVLSILARTGRTSRGTIRTYLCKSSRERVDPMIYSPEQRAKLEAGVVWEISQNSHSPALDAFGWPLVPQIRLHIEDGADGPCDAWPALCHIILRTFKSPSRVWIGAHIVEDYPS